MLHSVSLPSTVPTLSVGLRDATREAHRAAERCRFLRRLLRGDLPTRNYAAYLAALLRVYTALEAGLAGHHGHPALARFPWPALRRSDALVHDLAALLGPDWPMHVERDRSASAYVARLTAADPLRLLAHAYVRYLGDLSGGQLLREHVARFAPDAVGFYTFDGLDPAQERFVFRARLDELELGPREEAAVVAEAVVAFEMNTALLVAADTDVPAPS
jgi:heme oxygenase